jgi:hypothetical protein
VCVYVCMYVCVKTIYTYICTHAYVCMYIYIYICTHIHIYEDGLACVHVCIYSCKTIPQSQLLACIPNLNAWSRTNKPNKQSQIHTHTQIPFPDSMHKTATYTQAHPLKAWNSFFSNDNGSDDVP